MTVTVIVNLIPLFKHHLPHTPSSLWIDPFHGGEHLMVFEPLCCDGIFVGVYSVNYQLQHLGPMYIEPIIIECFWYYLNT